MPIVIQKIDGSEVEFSLEKCSEYENMKKEYVTRDRWGNLYVHGFFNIVEKA